MIRTKILLKKVGEKKGIIQTERVIYSEDGSTKKGVIEEQFAKVRKSKDAENIDSDNRKKEANNLRHQSKKSSECS